MNVPFVHAFICAVFFFMALCCPLICSSSLMDHHRKETCCYFLFEVDEQYVCCARHDCILYRLLTHITSQRRVGATITMEMGLTMM